MRTEQVTIPIVEEHVRYFEGLPPFIEDGKWDCPFCDDVLEAGDAEAIADHLGGEVVDAPRGWE